MVGGSGPRARPADDRWFFQLAGPGRQMKDDFFNGPGRHMRGDFSNEPGRHMRGEFSKGPVRAGKKRSEFFNGWVWLQKKEDE